MKSFNLERWLKQISQTEAEEISCSECVDLVDIYVEAEWAAARLDARLGRVKQHLDQCKACREEYQVLHDLVFEENQGQAPPIKDSQDSF